jgi:hypothetical protein
VVILHGDTKEVCNITARKNVVSSFTEDLVAVIAAGYLIISIQLRPGCEIVTVDDILPLPSFNRIIPGKAHDRIIAVATVDDVCATAELSQILPVIKTSSDPIV